VNLMKSNSQAHSSLEISHNSLELEISHNSLELASGSGIRGQMNSQ
jgi:hypothetical protein